MESLDKIPVGTAENLTGQCFGRLTALYRIKNNSKTRGAKWRCQCQCGNTVDVLAANLKKQHTLSCGCLQKEMASSKNIIDEVGKKYGRLTVLERADNLMTPSGGERVRWKCICDCGNITVVDGVSLRKGLTQSCGCYRKEQVSNRCSEKYAGKIFHYITVLEKTDLRQKNNEAIWKCKCNLCNNIFFISTGKIKNQISCGCINESYGVSIIKSILRNNNIIFETEKTFDTCYFDDSQKKARFDFFVNNKYIIEFDGKQHYSYSNEQGQGWNTKKQMERTQHNDKIKNEWCKKNNIPIIRIPYWKQDDIKIEDLILETSRYIINE